MFEVWLVMGGSKCHDGQDDELEPRAASDLALGPGNLRVSRARVQTLREIPHLPRAARRGHFSLTAH